MTGAGWGRGGAGQRRVTRVHCAGTRFSTPGGRRGTAHLPPHREDDAFPVRSGRVRRSPACAARCMRPTQSAVSRGAHRRRWLPERPCLARVAVPRGTQPCRTERTLACDRCGRRGMCAAYDRRCTGERACAVRRTAAGGVPDPRCRRVCTSAAGPHACADHLAVYASDGLSGIVRVYRSSSGRTGYGRAMGVEIEGRAGVEGVEGVRVRASTTVRAHADVAARPA